MQESILSEWLGQPVPPDISPKDWKAQQTARAMELVGALEDNLARFNRFVNDEEAFATVCLRKSETPIPKIEDAESIEDDKGDLKELAEEEDMGFDLYDEAS